MIQDIEFRRAVEGDREGILALVTRSLDWEENTVHEQLFHWKHLENPFGQSVEWVAVAAKRVIGYRSFLRWEFLGLNGGLVHAVRAVDTATDPQYRMTGIFRRLNGLAVDDLIDRSVDFIFNTPNQQSMHGNLRMGWRASGRIAVALQVARPSSVASLVMRRERAELMSSPTSVGEPACEAFGDALLRDKLLQHAPTSGVRTNRTAAYMAWRWAPRRLGYRLAFLSRSDPAEGGVVFRLRRRGSLLELVVAETLTSDLRGASRVVRRVMRETRSDYAIRVRPRVASEGRAALPWRGPVLLTRDLAIGAPIRREWNLSLGDIELF